MTGVRTSSTALTSLTHALPSTATAQAKLGEIREAERWAKKQGVDVAFAKKCGLKSRTWSDPDKQLRRFRAGIEGCISTAKRVFGLTRCLWKGWSHFQRYVHLSVIKVLEGLRESLPQVGGHSSIG